MSEKPPGDTANAKTAAIVDGAQPAAVGTGSGMGVPAIGELIADKYRVESVLGRGGMGVVLAARHVQLGEQVAIKILVVDPTIRGAFVSRFLQEARITAQLKNEHITRVIDVGTLPSGAPYMVMELVSGLDLREVLSQRGRLPVNLAAEYIVQTCEGLAEAHARGIIHRDIKPPNLFLTRRPDGTELVKILDFGISKMLEQPIGDLTETGVTMGSPRYMSPEQFGTSRELDARADIWALGAIFYELCIGTPCFDETTLASICARVISGKPPPGSIREQRPEMPEALERAVMSCLSIDRDARPKDVADLASRILTAIRAASEPERTARICATLGRAPPGDRTPASGRTPRGGSPLASVAGQPKPTPRTAQATAAPSTPNRREPLGEPVIALTMARSEVPPVTEWRSTWVTSSLQKLRERGLFDRYVECLPRELRSTLPLTVTGVWIPIATARAHYEACDALGLSQADARDLGLAVGERAQGGILRTGVVLAKGVGVDGWSVMNQVPRIWERGARGGAVAVYKTGPKEAVVEVLGCELFEVPYFRNAFHGVVLGVLRLITTRAYAQEKTTSVKSTFLIRLQWV